MKIINRHPNQREHYIDLIKFIDIGVKVEEARNGFIVTLGEKVICNILKSGTWKGDLEVM